MEAAEHPEDGAIREVFEETGLNVEIDSLLGAHSPGRNINVVILFYLAKTAFGNLVAGDDASDVRCFKLNELPINIAFDLHRHIINKWLDKIKVS